MTDYIDKDKFTFPVSDHKNKLDLEGWVEYLRDEQFIYQTKTTGNITKYRKVAVPDAGTKD